MFVELEDQAFVYTGHYDVESELKAKSTVDDPSTQQVVNALAAVGLFLFDFYFDMLIRA